MDVAQALAELEELSSQVERAVVLDGEGSVLGTTVEDEREAAELARAALGLFTAARDLRSEAGEVTRVEIQLAEGAFFVLREDDLVIGATTGPSPAAGLVAYDLRTCLQGIEVTRKPKRRRDSRKAQKKEAER
jgi:predicted regulator of Ras-like GTPase activity (Roadblock/LC7/MglB family)